MTRREEASLVAAAMSCDDCLCWLEHCHSECCHVFTFSITPRSDVDYLEDVVRIHVPMTPDAKYYYELHGAQVEGEFVIVPTSACEVSADRLVVKLTCGALGDEGLCELHDGRQPEACSGFTWETVSQGDWIVTPRCLFAYKLKAAGR